MRHSEPARPPCALKVGAAHTLQQGTACAARQPRRRAQRAGPALGAHIQRAVAGGGRDPLPRAQELLPVEPHGQGVLQAGHKGFRHGQVGVRRGGGRGARGPPGGRRGVARLRGADIHGGEGHRAAGRGGAAHGLCLGLLGAWLALQQASAGGHPAGGPRKDAHPLADLDAVGGADLHSGCGRHRVAHVSAPRLPVQDGQLQEAVSRHNDLPLFRSVNCPFEGCCKAWQACPAPARRNARQNTMQPILSCVPAPVSAP